MINERFRKEAANLIKSGKRLLPAIALVGNLQAQPQMKIEIGCPTTPGDPIVVSAYVRNTDFRKTLVLGIYNVDTGEGAVVSDDKQRAGYDLIFRHAAPIPYNHGERNIEIENGQRLLIEAHSNTPGKQDKEKVSEVVEINCPELEK